MCRYNRRCRHRHHSVLLREQCADRCRYNRSRILTHLDAGDIAGARRYADRLAADAMSSGAYDVERPAALESVNVERLSDDDLAALLSDERVNSDDAAVDYVMYELDQRDETARDATAAAEFESSTACAPARLGHLSEMRRARAHAEQWHTSVEAIDRVLAGPTGEANRMRLLGLFSPRSDSGRMSKKRRQEEAVKEHRALLHQQYIEAEDECRGNMLNRAARAKGVDPQELFTRPAQWVRANASEEFLRWRESNPRITQSQYLAAVGISGHEAAAATARQNEKAMAF